MAEIDWLTWVAAATAALWILDVPYVLRGVGKLGVLQEVEPLELDRCPPATVCVAARDEAADVEEAVRSFLAQDYPDLQVVAVDDRSTDGTGQILDRLAREHPALAVHRVERLPDGWLGKNHALQLAAREARGELLLFTDADVVMEPDTLRRAAARMEHRELDHLTMAPEQDWPGSLLRAVGALLGLSILHRLRPWRIGAPGSDAFAGVGAFNMVRRDAYRRAGEHRAIARRPVDDMALGERLHGIGARSELLRGTGLVRVRWYDTVGDFVRGAGRSMISDFGYSLTAAAATAAFLLLGNSWPWVGAVVLDGAARWLSLVPVTGSLVLYRALPGSIGARWWDALWWPVAGAVMAWTAIRAGVLVRWRGGIRWRGTFYPREELRG
jgi:glycosyltransferase involved in cell wall biosynthesis